MNLQTILAKTDKGVEEIETRRHKLDQRLRAILLLVNGKRTVAELAREYARLGDVPKMLQQLERDGFITSAEPAGKKLEAAKAEVSALIYEALGPDGSLTCEKAEECVSLAELRDYVMSRRDLFEAALGKTKADRLWTKLAKALG
ncbi:MAG TPA: hypothetical protein VF203_09380 [Burkholderiales bacterium]